MATCGFNIKRCHAFSCAHFLQSTSCLFVILKKFAIIAWAKSLLTKFSYQADNFFAPQMNNYLDKPIEVVKVLTMIEKSISIDPTQGASAKDAKPCTSTTAIFDKEEFISRSMGDLELSRYVASIFMENGPEYLESIRSALATEDSSALRKAAHKLKGAAATMALPLLAETASLLEEIAEAGEIKKAAGLLPELEQRFKQTLETLQDRLMSPTESAIP